MPTTIVEITNTQYAPIPGTSKHVLIGPGKLSITRRGDGSVHGHIVEGKSADVEVAIKRGLERVGWQ